MRGVGIIANLKNDLQAMKNLEIKARIQDFTALKIRLKNAGAKFSATLRQTDTYFNCHTGRLKLREFGDGSAELIHYDRPEKTAKRWSRYYICPIQRSAGFIDLMKRALGIKVTVKKVRRLYLYKNARIHLDIVAGLGKFIEVEVIVKKGKLQADKLMREILDIAELKSNGFIEKSYSDMALESQKGGN